MSGYPLFIPEFVLCTNSSLFWFKNANEPSEFRNYLVLSISVDGVRVDLTLKYDLRRSCHVDQVRLPIPSDVQLTA